MASGGARQGSGRKPYVEAPVKASNADKLARKETNESLKTTNKLSCPSFLTELAKKEWRRVMRLYRQMEADILSDLDITALIMYCEAWAIYKTAHAQWVQLLVVATTNPESQKVIDTCINTMNKQTQVVNKLAEQLCLTPVGRARMGINAAKEAKDPLLEFLNK